MRIRRLTIVGVALVAAIGLAGCGAAKHKATLAGAPATGSAAADASAAGPQLAAAVTELGEQSMRVETTMAGGVSMSGLADAKARTADMSMNLGAEAGEMRMVRVGDDVWLKFGGAMAQLVGGRDTWLHMDLKQAQNSAIGALDPAQVAETLHTAAGVRRVGDHAFTGTIDVTRTPGFADADAVKQMGDRAKALPFTARTDDLGRLVEITADMTGFADAAGTLRITYSDFGAKVAVNAPPPSQVTEMPGDLVDLLNG
jgi:hypothetical protein